MSATTPPGRFRDLSQPEPSEPPPRSASGRRKREKKAEVVIVPDEPDPEILEAAQESVGAGHDPERVRAEAKLAELIRVGRSRGASDIHLVAGLAPAYRVAGEILALNAPANDRAEMFRFVKGVLNPEQWAEVERTRELCYSIHDGEAGRVRVTVYVHAGCPELSIRLCTPKIPTAAELGLPSIVDDFARKPNGLILIAGPTGSGKTTTLSYIVDLINRDRRCKIVTIEDPVEFLHRPLKSIVVQQEVHTDTISFSRALVHVLRQNPDVIAIGEMRELETIETALTAAETGHLVIATLHTPNVSQTVERITSVFPGQQQLQVTLQLANSLQGIISQQLVPRADKKGRALAYEVLVATPAVRQVIRENKLHQLGNMVDMGRKEGMIAMDQTLLELYQKGLITFDAAQSRAKYPDRFSRDGISQAGSATPPGGPEARRVFKLPGQ